MIKLRHLFHSSQIVKLKKEINLCIKKISFKPTNKHKIKRIKKNVESLFHS